MGPEIYASDPGAAPDSEFLAGELHHLVVGNRGRLLDARRTPVVITAVLPATGSFEVEIAAFEDAGARWELPLQDVARFQFASGAAVTSDEMASELERAAEQFNSELVIESSAAVSAQTLGRIRVRRQEIHERLAALNLPQVDLAQQIARREGVPRLFQALEEIVTEYGIAELEHRFSTAFVSNPNSGEVVKGHAIVLAELGLCPFYGRIVRSPEVFTGSGSKPQRAEHLITRLAFTQEMWASWGRQALTLYRGAAVDGPLPPPSRGSFVSATLSRGVAEAHFEGGPRTQTAVIWRQEVLVTRVLMTFLETPEMSRQFREAEAVLIGDPANRAF